MRPNDIELKYNLGNGLVASERYDEAEEVLRQVVYEKPDHIRAQINLCAALKEEGRYDAAIRRHQKAINAVPDSAEAHWNLALTQLATGNYADGWNEYEWRSPLPGFAMEKWIALNGRAKTSMAALCLSMLNRALATHCSSHVI
jgi:tetratricopeptide (TPR) repeat protein